MGALLLTSEQMGVRVIMCQQNDRRYREEGDYILNRVITCDETCIHFFEPESKRQCSVWQHPSSPSPTKAIISKSAGEVMVIIFCDTYGVVLNHFVPPKTTFTGNYYATLLRTELMAVIRTKRQHLEYLGPDPYYITTTRQKFKPRCHGYTRKTRRRTVTAPTLQPGPSNL
jgi:histone-lysine N-methyltransferase SETMAR